MTILDRLADFSMPSLLLDLRSMLELHGQSTEANIFLWAIGLPTRV